MWICSKCKTENSDNYNFCNNCGNPKPKDRPTDKSWVCSNCKSENNGSDNFCKFCGYKNPAGTTAPGNSKAFPYGIAAVALVLILSIVIPRLRQADNAPPSTPTPTPTSIVTTTPKPVSTPKPSPTPSYKSVPENFTVHSDGRVDTMYEYIKGEKVLWHYHYDSNKVFKYRTCGIDYVEVYWSDDCLPNSYTTYHCFEPIYDCLSFGYIFTIPEVYSGTGTGDRTLYVKDCNGEWKTIMGFSYPEYDTVYVSVRFDTPTDIMAVGTLRNVDDPNSSYYIEASVVDVVVADYNYVGY